MQSEYNPADHLIAIKDRQGATKPYYPSAWRLYELSLRYPNANFLSEIIHLDPERDFVIIKARLYLGADWEMSDKKVEALKQGKLSMLDRIETAAKARAARDFGVSTEFALEFSDSDVDEPVETARPAPTPTLAQAKQPKPQPARLDPAIKARLWALYPRAICLTLCENQQDFILYIRRALQQPDLQVAELTMERLDTVEADIVAREQAGEAA